MLKRLKNNKEKDKIRPLKVRFSDALKSGTDQMIDFKINSGRSFAKWLLLYLLFSFVSILLFNTDKSLKINEFPAALSLIIPRMLILFLFSFPVFRVKRQKSCFVIMAGMWLLWMGAALGKLKIGLFAFAAVVLVAGFVFLSEKTVEKSRYLSIINELYIYIFFGVIMVFALQIAQMKNFNSAFEAMLLKPDILGCNLLCFSALGSFVYWVKRPKVAISFYSVLWITLAIISYVKSRNTFEPVLFLDLFSAKEGLVAFLSYYHWAIITLIVLGIVLAIAAIIFFATKEQKRSFSIIRLLSSMLFVLIVCVSVYTMSSLKIMKSESKTAKSEFDNKGFVYSFLFYSLDSFVVEPDGYGKPMINTIYDTLEKNFEPFDEKDSNVQNIIVIQLESFADPYLYPGIVLEEDPMPFIRSLMNNYTSGYVKVPVFGGLTVKSEFEFITGLSIENLPLGYNPYVTYVYDNQIDSLARYFSAQGYETTAIHNYQGEFFSRHEVYKNLGFDYYIPYECIPDIQKKESAIWANDSVFVDLIEKALDNNGDGKNFIFGITVQMHGKYNPIDKSEYTMNISGIKDPYTEGSMAYYIGQLQEVDAMIKELTAMLSSRDENTYVMFYGDHLPSIFVEAGDSLTNEQKYSTPYFSWNNMGIEKETHGENVGGSKYTPDIELFKLSTLICQELHINGGQMNRFHVVYSDLEKYAAEFSSIQYYKMYDEKNDVEFKNDNYVIGMTPLTVTSIEKNSNNGKCVIHGTGFTKDTYFCVNNKKVYGLNFINENTVILEDYEKLIESGETYSVRIIGEKMGNVLKESESYVWNNNS